MARKDVEKATRYDNPIGKFNEVFGGGGERGGDSSTTKITIEPMHWNLIAQKLGFVNHV